MKKDISRPIVAVRFMQERRSRSRGCTFTIGEMCEKYLDSFGVEEVGGYEFSSDPYHYFTDVDVQPGDIVVVRGGDSISIAKVDYIVTTGDVRATRTVIARMDFGAGFAKAKQRQRRQALVQKLEGHIRQVRAKEEVMSMAEHYAEKDAATKALLDELKSMETDND